MSSTIDTLLFFFYLYGASFGKRGPRGVYQAFTESQTALDELNYQTIKRALNNLTAKGLVARDIHTTEPTISLTTEGRARIEKIIPVYKTKRPWNGYVYLISYDIPRQANRIRNLLRSYIKQTGGALLQESLWLHPYDPHPLIREFTAQYPTQSTILVSKLGKDGAIGEETLLDLVARVYPISALAARYNAFINKYASIPHPSPVTLSLDYFSIVKDDPQLPAALLPKSFPADRATILFEKLRRQATTY